MPRRSSSAKKLSGALSRATVAASLPSSGQSLGDQRQQFRPILEARAIDEAENGRGGKRGKSAQRGIAESRQRMPRCDVAAELAAGMSRRLRIGVGEEIGDERGKPCAPRGLRERSSRDARDQKRAGFSLRVSGQERKRRGSRDRPAFPIRSSFRTVRPRSRYLILPTASAPMPTASVPGIGLASSFTPTPSTPDGGTAFTSLATFRSFGLLQLVERQQPASRRPRGEDDVGIARELGLLLLGAAVGIGDVDAEARSRLIGKLAHPLGPVIADQHRTRRRPSRRSPPRRRRRRRCRRTPRCACP